ncbi:hypothetical protein MJO28_005727 [Puccinia striiformis f. sp. tritici]|uniref:Uncharacterized protein n=1 Tax=Puccinia striiformis f. sp. tritici TaxID=168172 RepID=A0ACC0EN82_9BASI|nr:hypothetical protein MJO28_005727 [Puccinia striiformis f. sp. tritici]
MDASEGFLRAYANQVIDTVNRPQPTRHRLDCPMQRPPDVTSTQCDILPAMADSKSPLSMRCRPVCPRFNPLPMQCRQLLVRQKALDNQSDMRPSDKSVDSILALAPLHQPPFTPSRY